MLSNKTYLIGFSLLLLFGSCGKKQEENAKFQIQGKIIDEPKEGTALLLIRNLENFSLFDTLDTSKILAGKFRFSGMLRGPFPAEIHVKKEGKTVFQKRLILENANLEVELSSNWQISSVVRGGDYWNTLITTSSKIHRDYKKTLEAVMYWNMLKELKAMNANENVIKVIEKKHTIALDTSRSARRRIIKSIYEETNDTLFKLLYSYYRGGYIKDHVEYKTLLNKSEAIYGKDFYLVQYLKKQLEKNLPIMKAREAVSNGKKYINLIGKDSTNVELSLSEVVKKNKVVLVDFWASWCKPCIAEFPHLKKTYKKYHDKGFEIYGFSLDSKKESWLKVLKKENLPWLQALDLDAWKSKGAKAYGVNALPTTFLIVDGKIAGKDYEIKGKLLEKKLSALLD